MLLIPSKTDLTLLATNIYIFLWTREIDVHIKKLTHEQTLFFFVTIEQSKGSAVWLYAITNVDLMAQPDTASSTWQPAHPSIVSARSCSKEQTILKIP